MRLSYFGMLVALTALSGDARGDLILGLPDNGVVSAVPGESTGWGFTLDFRANPNNLFALITGSDFCVGSETSPCSNTLGSYSDIIGQNFIVLGPSSEAGTITQSFDPTQFTGVGSFLVDGVGNSLSGSIVVTYNLYATDADANNGGSPVESNLTVFAPATIEVTNATPEPSTFWLLFSVLFFMITRKLFQGGLHFPGKDRPSYQQK
jgi:hypothetical protein